MSNQLSEPMQLPIRCFLSYARADDESLNFIAPLKDSLEHFCYSDSGRRLEIFIDRETIGWGENWRDRIAESVTSAMVFIPVVSIQYFDRESCRTELQAFHAAAKNRGVTDLLLPLVALGSRHITQESDDPLVRIVEELQNIDIRAAILAGTSTREWRTTMVDVAHKLVAAVERAEQTLQRQDGQPTGDSRSPAIPEDDDENQLGLHELESRLEERSKDFATAANNIVQKMEEFAGIVTSRTAQLREAAPETGRVVAVELANDVTALALDIQQLGAVIETAVSEIDADVRQYYSLVMQFGSPEMRETMGKDIAELGAQFSELNETAVVIAEFLEQMKPVEILNAPLRRSLRPLRTGVVSMQVAIATTQSWGRIGT